METVIFPKKNFHLPKQLPLGKEQATTMAVSPVTQTSPSNFSNPTQAAMGRVSPTRPVKIHEPTIESKNKFQLLSIVRHTDFQSSQSFQSSITNNNSNKLLQAQDLANNHLLDADKLPPVITNRLSLNPKPTLLKDHSLILVDYHTSHQDCMTPILPLPCNQPYTSIS